MTTTTFNYCPWCRRITEHAVGMFSRCKACTPTDGTEAMMRYDDPNFDPVPFEYPLSACRRCGAAVPNDEVHRAAHDGFHEHADEVAETANTALQPESDY
jgi:hypothetical protein